MLYCRKSIPMLTVILGFLVFASVAQANLVDQTYGIGSGSFELGGPFVGTAHMWLSPGSTTITGWTVSGPGDGVDWLQENNTFNFNADTGTKSVDLRHLTASSISTMIPTVSGNVYRLSFAAAAVTPAGNNTGLVSAGSLVNQTYTVDWSPTFSSQTFLPFTFDFTATGSETTIIFQATGITASNQYSYGPAIDSVRVDAVPVPPAMILLGSGLLGLIVMRSRLRK